MVQFVHKTPRKTDAIFAILGTVFICAPFPCAGQKRVALMAGGMVDLAGVKHDPLSPFGGAGPQRDPLFDLVFGPFPAG
jgi:hypothetical protein